MDARQIASLQYWGIDVQVNPYFGGTNIVARVNGVFVSFSVTDEGLFSVKEKRPDEPDVRDVYCGTDIDSALDYTKQVLRYHVNSRSAE